MSPRSTARLALAALLVGASAVNGAETVREFSGSMSRNLPDFEVEAPWILEWRVTTESEHQAGVDVSLEQAGTGVHQGSVLKTKWPGNGVRLFDAGGKFYFRVNSSFATWHLKVVQLTAEEARAYTPRNPVAPEKRD